MSSVNNTALLVMDYQEGIVSRFAGQDLIDRANAAIAHARSAGIPVIFVVVRFRDGYPEISPNNMAFSGLKSSGFDLTETASSTRVHPSIKREAGDVLVTKRRVGAFAGSDLEIVLRSKRISSLVLAGISTSGVVLSTLRLAADMDYRLAVLSDACADNDEEVHRVLMEKVFPRQAIVSTVAEWIASAA